MAVLGGMTALNPTLPSSLQDLSCPWKEMIGVSQQSVSIHPDDRHPQNQDRQIFSQDRCIISPSMVAIHTISIIQGLLKPWLGLTSTISKHVDQISSQWLISVTSNWYRTEPVAHQSLTTGTFNFCLPMFVTRKEWIWTQQVTLLTNTPIMIIF